MRYIQTANSLAHGANTLVHIAVAVADPTMQNKLCVTPLRNFFTGSRIFIKFFKGY